MNRRFEGKIAIVTGAGAGIGRACMARLASEGAVVVGTDVKADKLDAAVAAAGTDAHGLICDVADPAAIDAMVAEVVARFGGVHVLVNNAGIGNPGGSASTSSRSRTGTR
ncbi:SDR family NAD(P)-dependent oxidoreductase [Rhizorhabdus histidinilytica]